jgi:hypothetical protein
MSDSASSAGARKRSRVGEYFIVAVVLGLVVAAAVYQEPLTAFFKMRMWDTGGPGRTVESFLKAGKSGDKAAADRLVGPGSLQPLMEEGKWVGYFVMGQGGPRKIPFSGLQPEGNPPSVRTEFLTVGNPSAQVYVRNASGRDVRYQLEMQKDGWKIIAIN